MPPDLTKAGGSSRLRRAGRRESEEVKYESTREIELKRSRGEISCAECRRLKIRCDKTIPCQSCQRRGCATLCPNGSLATGQGTRFVLAATEHLHKRLAKMGERVRQLEDALAIAHAKYSNEPHPLLSSGQSEAVFSEEEEEVIPEEDIAPTVQKVIDSLGTLSLSERGGLRFFGPTGGAEYLLTTKAESDDSSFESDRPPSDSLRDSSSPAALPDLAHFSSSFPFSPVGSTQDVYELVRSHLPSLERATQLCEVFVERAGWIFMEVTRGQLIDEMIPHFYRNPSGLDPIIVLKMDYAGPHALALFFLIMSIAVFVEPDNAQSQAEGEHFAQLGKAALCLRPVMVKPSLVTIQALSLFGVYYQMADADDSDVSMEMCWGLCVLAAQLAHGIGLHRDCARWGLHPKIIHRRRTLFWALFTRDVWQSLMTGRPPCFSREYSDCKYPFQNDEGFPEEEIGSEEATYYYTMSRNLIGEVVTKALTAEAPSYEAIMQLDKHIREYPRAPGEPAVADKEIEDPNEPLSLGASMSRFTQAHTREVLLQFIHRSFFAQAIIDYGANPLRSPYAASFLTTYRSSCVIIKCARDQFALYPQVCVRMWPMWTFAFASAVVFGTVVMRGPRSPLASAAAQQLDLSYDLFEQASRYSPRAGRALAFLSRLREKAQGSLSTIPPSVSSQPMLEGAVVNIKKEEFEDNFEIFAGRAKLVASKKLSRSPSQDTSQRRPAHAEPPPYDFSAPSNMAPVEPIMQPQLPALHVSAGSSSEVWSSGLATSTPFSGVVPPVSYPMIDYSRSHHPHVQPVYTWQQPQNVPPQAPQQHAASQYQVAQAGPSDYQNHVQLYSSAPTSVQPGYPVVPPPYNFGPAELGDMGLGSRELRLNERWTSFMHQSGFFDGTNYNQ